MEWGISLAFKLTRVCQGGCNHSVTLGVVRQGIGAVLNRVRAVPGWWVELEAPHARTEGRLARRHNPLPMRVSGQPWGHGWFKSWGECDRAVRDLPQSQWPLPGLGGVSSPEQSP